MAKAAPEGAGTVKGVDVELVVLEAKRRLTEAGCDCDVQLEIEDCGTHFMVSSTHHERCHLSLVQAGVAHRLN